LALLALAATALLALPSAAAADVEPNDGITQTEGPLTGGTTYSGSLSTENDEDWYSFYVSSQTQLDVSLSVPAGSACDPRFTLSDTDGGFIESERVDPNETFHFRYTTAAGTNRYLLSVSGCQGATYQFSLNPAASIVSGPGRAPAQGTPEPNDNESQAVGPLSGGQLYSASIDTQNDVDFFYFYSSGTQPFDVSLSPVTGCPPEAQLDGPGTESVDNRTSLSENRTSHIALTPPGQERYVLQVSGGCPGSAYEFRIDPPSAITTTPPPSFTPPPPTDSRCLSARNSVAKWSSKVKATKKALKRRGSRKRKRQLRDKLGAQKRNLKRAKVKVNRYC
jgi:opacity protein-like surface antigen